MDAERGDEQLVRPRRPQLERRVPRLCAGVESLMYGHRVVVTGLGCISPIGLSVDQYWNNLLAGVSGAGRITTFDPEGLPVQIAAEVKDFDPGDYMDRKA